MTFTHFTSIFLRTTLRRNFYLQPSHNSEYEFISFKLRPNHYTFSQTNTIYKYITYWTRITLIFYSKINFLVITKFVHFLYSFDLIKLTNNQNILSNNIKERYLLLLNDSTCSLFYKLWLQKEIHFTDGRAFQIADISIQYAGGRLSVREISGFNIYLSPKNSYLEKYSLFVVLVLWYQKKK